jgi:serine/threonine protein kinase
VMEYASGGSLAGYLARQPGGRLSEAAAKHVFGSILAGLEYCHMRWAVLLRWPEITRYAQNPMVSEEVSSSLCSSGSVCSWYPCFHGGGRWHLIRCHAGD